MFDREELRRALVQGRVARVVIAGFEGHSPREVGAAMLVWDGGQSGTVGGGALEFQAARRARELLATGGMLLDREALGPALGQCCGGVVTLLTEVYDAVPEGPVVARGPGEMPLAVGRMLAAARGQGVMPQPGLVQGWMVEPVAVPQRQVWVWGAGHVGRALVSVLAPLPGLVPVSGYITNQASASAQLMDPFPDNSTNIAVTTTVTTAADMALLKFGPATADSDSLYQYTLRATNNGPSVATNVQIVDTVPAAIQLVTAGPGWTCATSGSTLTCDYGSNLAAGATASDVVVTVKAPNVNAALSNTASVSSAQPDAQPLNNTATVTTAVNNCRHNEVALDHSTLTASPTDVYADNASTSRVLVTLRDACDNILASPPYDLQNVTLSSSRGGLDTITPLAPTGNGQYLFDVKSGTSGTSTYSATATNSVNSTTVNLSATAQVNYYGCVSMQEHVLAGSLNFLHLDVLNNSGLTRRLTGVSLIWPQRGGRKIQSVTLQATTLWSGNSNNNPFVIPSGGLDWIAGTDAARSIASGAGTQALKLNFSYSIAAGEQYSLVTTWDDGSGARVCTVTTTITH